MIVVFSTILFIEEKYLKQPFFVPHSIAFHYYHHVHIPMGQSINNDVSMDVGVMVSYFNPYSIQKLSFEWHKIIHTVSPKFGAKNHKKVTSFIDAQLLKYECSTTHAVSTTTFFNAANLSYLSQNQRVIARKLKVNKFHWLDIW